MFTLFQLKKNLLHRKSLTLIFLLPLLIVGLCSFIQSSSADKTKIYSGAIIDRDNTSLSSKLIQDMRGYTELKIDLLTDENAAITDLSRNKYDVVYIINAGFQESIMKGSMTKVLTAHSRVDTPSVKWVNDQISLRVMRMWSYYDILHKIQNLDPYYTEETYEKNYQKRQESNRILTLQVHYADKQALLPQNDSMGFKVFRYLWIYIILFLSMGALRKTIEERLSGIRQRLEFSAVSKTTYLLTSAVILLATVLLPFLLSLIILAILPQSTGLPLVTLTLPGILLYLLTIALATLVAWTAFYLVSLWSKSVQSYNMVTQLLFIGVIILSGILM